MKLIELKNVSLGYEGKTVLKNINVSFDEGDFIIIVGPNGSGKSTLVKGILGLIPLEKGTVKYNNLPKNFIGYMPQETKVDKNFPASVYEIVLSGRLNSLGKKLFYSKEDKRVVMENLKLLHIENLKDKNFSELSGGQRQKVLLARSLCSTNKLLILDEPSNNLDYDSKIELYNIAKELNKDKNVTIIMITHDLDNENLIGNRVLSLKDKEMFYGTNEEYRRHLK